jgi:hypothetical protein
MALNEILDLARACAGMSRSEFVSTTGAVFGFLGGLLLAFAASSELRAYRLAISALQAETFALITAVQNPTAPLLSVTGTEKHIEAGQSRNTFLTWAGIICLAISFVFTVGAFFVKTPEVKG